MFGGGEKRMDIVDGSCKRREGGLIKARGVYMWQANHLWSVEELIPEGRVSKWETALS